MIFIKKLSIIIPMYNSQRYIKECIDSIISQIDDSVEIILIDDGSIDDTRLLCGNYINNSNVFYYYITNHGISYARNFGLNKAIGNYVMFVDSDDCWSENTYSIINEYFSKSPDLIIFQYGKLLKNKILNKKFKDNYLEKNILENVFTDNSISGFVWNKVFKRDIIINNNLLFDNNINFCEDLTFVSQYVNYIDELNVIYINMVLYLYRIRKTSVSINFYNSSNKTIIKAYSNLLELFSDKNFSYKIKEDYLFSLRRFGVDDIPVSLNEKNVVSKMHKSKKIKYYFLKYCRSFYIFVRNIFYKFNINYFE